MVIPLTTEKAEGREQEQRKEGTGWTKERRDGRKQKQKEVKTGR